MKKLKKIKCIRMYDKELETLKLAAKKMNITQQEIIERALNDYYSNNDIEHVTQSNHSLTKFWINLSEDEQDEIFEWLLDPSDENRKKLRELLISAEDVQEIKSWISKARIEQREWREEFKKTTYSNPLALTWTFLTMPSSKGKFRTIC